MLTRLSWENGYDYHQESHRTLCLAVRALALHDLAAWGPLVEAIQADASGWAILHPWNTGALLGLVHQLGLDPGAALDLIVWVEEMEASLGLTPWMLAGAVLVRQRAERAVAASQTGDSQAVLSALSPLWDAHCPQPLASYDTLNPAQCSAVGGALMLQAKELTGRPPCDLLDGPLLEPAILAYLPRQPVGLDVWEYSVHAERIGGGHLSPALFQTLMYINSHDPNYLPDVLAGRMEPPVLFCVLESLGADVPLLLRLLSSTDDKVAASALWHLVDRIKHWYDTLAADAREVFIRLGQDCTATGPLDELERQREQYQARLDDCLQRMGTVLRTWLHGRVRLLLAPLYEARCPYRLRESVMDVLRDLPGSSLEAPVADVLAEGQQDAWHRARLLVEILQQLGLDHLEQQILDDGVAAWKTRQRPAGHYLDDDLYHIVVTGLARLRTDRPQEFATEWVALQAESLQLLGDRYREFRVLKVEAAAMYGLATLVGFAPGGVDPADWQAAVEWLRQAVTLCPRHGHLDVMVDMGNWLATTVRPGDEAQLASLVAAAIQSAEFSQLWLAWLPDDPQARSFVQAAISPVFRQSMPMLLATLYPTDPGLYPFLTFLLRLNDEGCRRQALDRMSQYTHGPVAELSGAVGAPTIVVQRRLVPVMELPVVSRDMRLFRDALVHAIAQSYPDLDLAVLAQQFSWVSRLERLGLLDYSHSLQLVPPALP